MIVTQFVSDGKNGIGHLVDGPAKDTTTSRQTGQHIEFITVLAVDGDWNPCETRCRNGLDGTPITGVHDVWPVCPHQTCESKKGELKATFRFSGSEQTATWK